MSRVAHLPRFNPIYAIHVKLHAEFYNTPVTEVRQAANEHDSLSPLMDSLKEWLKQHGLDSLYAPLNDSDIDLDIIVDLTESDLADIGLSLGQRKRLLRAVATLKNPPTAESNTVLPVTPRPSIPEPGPERRQLTVVFCDLMGSTEMSQRLDLEDLRDALMDYQNTVSRVFEDSRGFIARYMGDGVLVYYGYPMAMEDDAFSAVQAAQEVIGIFDNSPRFIDAGVRVRIGIATGLVLAGEIVGSGASEEHTVLGRTPNLAARLQGVAGPNQMVIDDQTWSLIRRRYESNVLDGLQLKGFSGTLSAYEVPHQQPRPAYTEQADNRLIGRESEMLQLQQIWNSVRSGHGCFVMLIEGEPGIGKSRLIREMRNRLEPHPPRFTQWMCSPHAINSAFFAVAQYVQELCEVTTGQDSERRHEIPASSIAHLGLTEEKAVKLAQLLGVIEASPDLKFDTPRERRVATIELLLETIEAMTTNGPAILVVEDVHAIDPSTLEFIKTLISRIESIPLMVAVTCRPEFDSSVFSSERLHKLSLQPLDDDDCSKLIAELGKLPGEIAREILRKADGIPLFVEEITHALFEAAKQQLSADSPEGGIPSSLQSLLLAKLDRLGSARELAQIAAVIGDRIDIALLRYVSATDESTLQSGLKALGDAGVLVQASADHDGQFRFRHMLFQEVAYQTLLRDDRRRIHLSVGVGIRDQQPELAAAQPERVARHFTSAGSADDAMGYWLKAATRASGMNANNESLAHIDAAMPLLQQLASNSTRDNFELDLNLVKASVLRGTTGPGTEVIARVYERSLSLCEAAGSEEKLIPVLNGLYIYNLLRARYHRATEFANRLLELANKSSDVTGKVVGHRALGAVCFNTGRLAKANEQLQSSRQLYDVKIHGNSATVIGADHLQVATSLYCLTLAIQGWPKTAIKLHLEELKRARDLGHAHNIAQLLVFLTFHTSLSRSPEMVDYCDQLDEVAREYQFPMMMAGVSMFRGSWQLHLGNREHAVELLSEGCDAYLGTGTLNYLPYFEMRTAEAWLSLNNYEKAKSLLEISQERIVQTGEYWCQAEWLRLRGEYEKNANNNVEGAAEYYRQSIEDADSRGAALWKLQTLRSLATTASAHTDVSKITIEELLKERPELAESSDNTDSRET